MLITHHLSEEHKILHYKFQDYNYYAHRAGNMFAFHDGHSDTITHLDWPVKFMESSVAASQTLGKASTLSARVAIHAREDSTCS